MFKLPIAISLSPNTRRDDVLQAIRTILAPWKWKSGKSIENVENWFKKYFKTEEAVSFVSGRLALYALLKTFGIGRGDEVVLQAFTCVVVPNSIILTGAKPVYVDIDDSLNIDPDQLEKAISSKTKAIIVQHTFGIPAKIDMIKKIVQKFNLVLIEDCAHSLGASYKGKKIGLWGDAAFFSFGRDKVISSVFGGMAVVSSRLKAQGSRLRKIQQSLDYPSYFWIFQQLFHPIAFSIILPLYNVQIGKLILLIAQKLALLSKPVSREELVSKKPFLLLAKYPNALAKILELQLQKLDEYNNIRNKITSYYFEGIKKTERLKLPYKSNSSVYLRFNILTEKSEDVLSFARKHKILLGNWYRNIIDPHGVMFEKIAYNKGSCPRAEKTAKLSVNLPTYPRLTTVDLDKIINLFDNL